MSVRSLLKLGVKPSRVLKGGDHDQKTHGYWHEGRTARGIKVVDIEDKQLDLDARDELFDLIRGGPERDSSLHVNDTRPGVKSTRNGVDDEGRPVIEYGERNKFGNFEVTSTAPPSHIFRAVSEDDFQRIMDQGFIDTAGDLNLGPEGLNAARDLSTFYLPKLGSGRVLRIQYDPADGWRVDPADGYIKTHSPVPASRIDLVSPIIEGRIIVEPHRLGAEFPDAFGNTMSRSARQFITSEPQGQELFVTPGAMRREFGNDFFGSFEKHLPGQHDQKTHGNWATGFHGTTGAKGNDIIVEGFDLSMAGKMLGSLWGDGAYFTPTEEKAQMWAKMSTFGEGAATVLKVDVPEEADIFLLKWEGIMGIAKFSPSARRAFLMDLSRSGNPEESLVVMEEAWAEWDASIKPDTDRPTITVGQALQTVLKKREWDGLEVIPGGDALSQGGHQLVLWDPDVVSRLKVSEVEMTIGGKEFLSKRQTWYTASRRPIRKHGGPGPHKGTGTPQSIHGRRGAGGVGVGPGDAEFLDRTPELDALLGALDTQNKTYKSPIEHDHAVGDMSAELEEIMVAGSPIRERFTEYMGTYEERRMALNLEYDDLNNQWGELTDVEAPLNRRAVNSINRLAQAESRRYPGMSREIEILQYLMDPDNGATISARLDGWRTRALGGNTSIEIELSTRTQWENVIDVEERVGIDNDGIDRNNPPWEIIENRSSTGKVTSAILRIDTEAGRAAWQQRFAWSTGDEEYYGTPAAATMWRKLKLQTQNAPPFGTGISLNPEETYTQLTFETGSGYLWDRPLDSQSGNASDVGQNTFLAGRGELFSSTFEGTADGGVAALLATDASENRVVWRESSDGWVGFDPGTEDDLIAPYKRIVPNSKLVDRYLQDADFAYSLQQDLTPQINILETAKSANSHQRLSLSRTLVGEFLESEGIRTGTSVDVARRVGVGKRVSEDTAFMPAVWIERYNNEMLAPNGYKLKVQKKAGGGTFWTDGKGFGSSNPEMMTNGATATNIHEMGHGIEDLAGMRPIVKEFVNYRTDSQGISGVNVKNGRQYKDSFSDGYSGKIYNWGHYEAFSNGLGNMYGGHRGTPDDEHLDFLFGLMDKTARD